MDCIEELHLVDVPQQFAGGAPVAARHLRQALLLSLALHLAGGLFLVPYLRDAAGRLAEARHESAIWVVPVSPPAAAHSPDAPRTMPRHSALRPGLALPDPAVRPARQAAPPRGNTAPLQVAARSAAETKGVPAPPAPLAPVATLPADPALMVLPGSGAPAVVRGKAGGSLPAPAAANREGATGPALPGAYSPASYQNNPVPEYPPLARRLRQQGTSILRVWVSALGTAEQVNLRESSGSRVLDQAALEAVRQWRFAPARSGANPISSWVEVPVSFRFK